MPKMEEKLSFLSLSRHIKYMRSTGLYRLDQKTPKVYRYFHMIYMLAVLSFFAIYTVQQILKIYQVRDNLNKVMATMFLLLTNTDCLYKIVIFWKKPKQIEEVLNTFKGPIFNQGESEHRSILLDTVRSALLILRIFKYMCLVTCFLWVLHPTVLHMQGKQIEFSVWLPFDANNDPFYYVAVIYVWIQTSWLAYSNSTMDVFIAFLLEQCRTQVTILRLDLENLVQKSKKEAIATHCPFKDIFEFRFNKIIKHHKEIVNTADKIQDVFGEAVFYQFCVSGWILCTSAIMIVSTKPGSIEFVSMIMYVACILIEVYLFCYYGNELTYESEKLTESAYCVDWLEIPVKQRRSLIIFMERVKRPIRPMAGLIIPLSNSTFISIIRSSYSFYALLKNSAH